MVGTEFDVFALHPRRSVSVRNCVWLCLFLCAAATCGRATAARAQIPVGFGEHTHWLQELVDHRYGNDHIDVRTDYIGAHAGDADPWYLTSGGGGVLWIKLLKGGSRHDVLGWYVEDGVGPRLPEGGGVLFGEQGRAGDATAVNLPPGRTGFYLDCGGSEELAAGRDSDPGAEDQEGPKRFYTNRLLNVAGPGGAGATQPPFDGDIQALVFDVSRWAGGNTWLVCFEDQDTGRPGRRSRDFSAGEPDDGPDPPELDRDWPDNDFFDVVFEVRADGATPAHPVSFGALKLRYR